MKYELGNICSRLSSGKNIPAKLVQVQGKYPVYGGNGLRGYTDVCNFDGECAIIGRQGAFCGNVRYFKGSAYMTEHAVVVCADENNNTRYLAYLLSTMYLGRLSAQSAQPGLSVKTLSKQMVEVPELGIQNKIINILSALDDKIELNNKINENLEQQAQALFVQKFIDDKMEGEERPLYDFADYINGAAFKPKECGEYGLPIIKIAELKNGITPSTKYFDGIKGEKYLIQNKDILFSWSGNPDTSIDIFIWTSGKAILNQHTFNVKSYTGHRWFIFLLLKYFKPEFSRIASNKQTTGLGHVTASDLKRLTFIYNEAVISDFEKEVSPFMEIIYSNLMENQRLAQLRDTLLPKLMNGEIEIDGI